ncbi:MAG: ATP-binding protein, partial [Chloroflexota bacterium]
DESGFDAAHADDIDKIRSSGQSLLHIINAILDLTKVDAEQMGVEMTSFSLLTLTREVVDMVRPMANANNNQLHIKNLLPANFEHIWSDRQKLRQVVINLLSNASKYTQDGEIWVTLEIEPEGSELKIGVSDSGIGLSKQNFEEIFEPFTQVDSTTTRSFSGTGLGLAISQRFAQLLGGRIDLESELGVGSTFTLIVPLKVEPEPASP